MDFLLRQQSGVISRRQALDTGLQHHQIRRLLRRNEWARVHHGVYVNHTGPLTWINGPSIDKADSKHSAAGAA